MEDLKELKLKYEELGKEIERLENKKEIWEPKEGEVYYHPIITRTKVFSNPNSYQDFCSSESGSFAIFQTEEECENFCNILEAIAEMKAWQKVYGSGDWYLFVYDDGLIGSSNHADTYSLKQIVRFSSKKACSEIIPRLTENCKRYLRGETNYLG